MKVKMSLIKKAIALKKERKKMTQDGLLDGR